MGIIHPLKVRKLGLKMLHDILRPVNEAVKDLGAEFRHLSWVVLWDLLAALLSELTIWLTRGSK